MLKTLDKYVPIKKKYTRGNNMQFMNKTLTNAQKNRTF